MLFRIKEQRLRAELARRLRAARTDVYGSRSQARFAALIGVKQSQISRWESATSLPRLPDLIRYAERCNTTVEELLDGLSHPIAVQPRLLDRVEPEARGVVLRLIDLLEKRPSRRRRRARSA
jgi:transcriptional regulator with XRE-family HTH domain